MTRPPQRSSCSAGGNLTYCLSLRPLQQGVRTGSYGPHGLEVLQLAVSSSEDDVPPGCPIRGPRLQGLKLLGDPNVPALRCEEVTGK